MPAEKRPVTEVAPRVKAAARVDTESLTGMRGVAAFQVAFGHVGLDSASTFDTMGATAMPFFFLLSGYEQCTRLALLAYVHT
eukprot:SAG11_NODE_14793_length_599_cov_1.228000_1_plen_82_part_00